MSGLLPALAALIAMLTFINYPLDDEKFKQIRDETEARKMVAIDAHEEERQDLIVAEAV